MVDTKEFGSPVPQTDSVWVCGAGCGRLCVPGLWQNLPSALRRNLRALARRAANQARIRERALGTAGLLVPPGRCMGIGNMRLVISTRTVPHSTDTTRRCARCCY